MNNNFFRRLYVFPLLLALASCSMQQTSIQEIDSLEQAQPILEQAGKNSLVIFDIDDTLTYPTDTIQTAWGQSTEGREFYRKLEEHIASSPNPDELSGSIFSKILLAVKPHTVEPQTASVIKKLQDRGIKAMALTNWPTGKLGKIPSMPAWRFDKLAEVRINFSTGFDLQEIFLNKNKDKFTSDKQPVFYKGILLTDGADKGSVLGAFLDFMHYTPDRIIFFDDRATQVESGKNEAKVRGIPFYGFVYKAAEKLSRQYDPAIIALQLEYLIKHDEYITEEQARELLKK